MEIIKFISLVFAIFLTVVNTLRVITRLTTPGINFLLQAIAITVFLFIQFHL